MELTCPYCATKVTVDAKDIASFNVRGAVEDRGILHMDVGFIVRHKCAPTEPVEW